MSPDRIPALLRLLQDIASDVGLFAGRHNPLRQVIIFTHSPAVVAQAPEDSLLIAERVLLLTEHGRGQSARFSALPGTWRQEMPGAGRPAPLGALLAYLNPVLRTADADADTNGHPTQPGGKFARRGADRDDLQRLGVVAPHVE